MQFFRHSALPIAVVATTLAVTGCLFDRSNPSGPAPQHPGDTTSNDSVSTPEIQLVIDSIAAALETIRGLQFLRPVYGRVLSHAEWSAHVSELFDSSWIGSYGTDFSVELYHLGFVRDSTFDYFEEYSGAYEQGVAGFYMPGTDSLYAIGYNDMVSRSELEFFYFVVSHELTHALQDQHFGIFGDNVESDIHDSWAQSDFQYAFQHIYEGDAELASLVYYFGTVKNVADPFDSVCSFVSALREELFNLPAVTYNGFIDQPFFINFISYSPYVTGTYFVGQSQRAAGWSSINDMYSGRSFTMAQVITGEPVTMRAFPVQELRDILDAGSYSYWDDDNYGALLLTALLARQMTAADAAEAFGWRGDYLLYLKDSGERFGRFVWAFSLASKEKAQRFIEILDEHVQARLDTGLTLYSTTNEQWAGDPLYHLTTHEGPNLHTALAAYENEVYWLENVGFLQDTVINVLINSRGQQLAKAPARHAMRKKVMHLPRAITALPKGVSRQTGP